MAIYTQPNLDVSNATKYLRLNATDAEGTNNRWQGYQPDATNFYLGNSTEVNASGGTYVAYVFAEKQGTVELVNILVMQQMVLLSTLDSDHLLY